MTLSLPAMARRRAGFARRPGPARTDARARRVREPGRSRAIGRTRSALSQEQLTKELGGNLDAHLADAHANRYDLVILGMMKTAISLPDDTFERVERAAKKLGVSRSEFFARAAEHWLNALDDVGTTEAINSAIAGLASDDAFTDAAAAALLEDQA